MLKGQWLCGGRQQCRIFLETHFKFHYDAASSRRRAKTVRYLISVILAIVGLTAHAAERPNILYIMADDHAAHAISALGSTINKTPNIDRIASAGMRFTNCFVTNSICTPSRAAILTG